MKWSRFLLFTLKTVYKEISVILVIKRPKSLFSIKKYKAAESRLFYIAPLVRGAAALLFNLKAVYSSLYTAKKPFYRQLQGVHCTRLCRNILIFAL